MAVLKVILIVLLCIVLLIALILSLYARIYISYEKEVRVRIGFFGIKYTVYPQKPKKEKKNKKQEKAKPKQKKENPFKKVIEEKGLSGFIDLLKQLAGLGTGTLCDLFSNIIFTRFKIDISCTGTDAAQTAINYGYCCSAVYPAAALILKSVKSYKNYNVAVNPDFTEGAESKITAEINAKIRVFRLLVALIKFGVNYSKIDFN